MRSAGLDQCEVCGWKTPKSMQFYVLVTIHHIKAVADGGSVDDRENFAVLCPNHHRIADLICRPHSAPQSKAELLQRLRDIDNGL